MRDVIGMAEPNITKQPTTNWIEQEKAELGEMKVYENKELLELIECLQKAQNEMSKELLLQRQKYQEV